jgi:FkbH-like protein
MSALEKIRSAPEGGLSSAEYSRLARELASGSEKDGLVPIRLVILASFTATLLDPFLKVEAARHGFWADVFHGGFGQFEQVLLGDAWRARDGVTEVLVVAMRPEDLAPDAPFRVEGAGGAPGTSGADVLARIEATLDLFRARSTGPALVASFAPASVRLDGVFDANRPGSYTHGLAALNQTLASRLATRAGTAVWDYAGLVASRGAARWTDPRLWALARMPVAAANQPAFAQHLIRTVLGMVRPPSKCLVLDLDNTLWGGVVGDDGPSGVQVGDEFPGRAFKELQRVCLGLRDRGILLAISSKNEPEPVHECFANHPEMLLRLEHFAATRITWNPKSQSLREIAEELNIGLGSLVFFDDNPVERAEVREHAPEVQVVDLPTDPAGYAAFLADLALFDMPAITDEDRIRAGSYQAEAQRTRAASSAGSLEEFLASLEMQVEIGALDGATSPRVAQLVSKTNQFNTTTQRLTQAELEALHAGERQGVWWLRQSDRYGDMGLVAVGLLTADGEDAVIRGLIMSCRVANRGIEQTMLAHLVREARARGFKALVGEYVPTKKNNVIAELFPKHGFAACEPRGEVVRHRLDLAGADLRPPSFVRVRVHEHGGG